MIDRFMKNEHAGSYSRRQLLFSKYTMFVLIDLVVLNLFDEYWGNVYIEYFSISLLTAVLLQVFLQLTIAIERRVANIFKGDTSLKSKIMRGLSTWAILFISKLVILQAINYAFGDSVLFSGPVHGLVAFIIVIFAIIIAEQVFLRIYRSLGNA